MRDNLLMIEHYYLSTLPEEHEREIEHITLIQEACRAKRKHKQNIFKTIRMRVSAWNIKLEEINERS